MQILRDAATLGILILLALTVRIDFGDAPEGFGGVHAGSPEPAIEETLDAAADPEEGITADLPLTATTTVVPFPGDDRRVVGLGDGRILVIIEEAVEAAPDVQPQARPEPPPCEKPQPHRSC